MQLTDQILAAVLDANNERMRADSAGAENPFDLRNEPWHARLVDRTDPITQEWAAATGRGLRLPRIGDVLREDQGQIGTWRIGLLVANGAPVDPLAQLFPRTVEALAEIPRLRSALWSVLEPGTELPEHRGPNAGVLRYHLGIRCGEQAALRVGRRVVPFRDGEGVLFDDTEPHAAWNRGTDDRVTIFCELDRDVSGPPGIANRLVQRMLALDPRYRRAPARAAAWHLALNPQV